MIPPEATRDKTVLEELKIVMTYILKAMQVAKKFQTKQIFILRCLQLKYQ